MDRNYQGWTMKELQFIRDNYKHMNDSQLAENLGRSQGSVRNRRVKLRLFRPENVYALYQGDNILATGTVKEISKQLGVKTNTVRAYGTPAYAEKISESGRRLIKIN